MKTGQFWIVVASLSAVAATFAAGRQSAPPHFRSATPLGSEAVHRAYGGEGYAEEWWRVYLRPESEQKDPAMVAREKALDGAEYYAADGYALGADPKLTGDVLAYVIHRYAQNSEKHGEADDAIVHLEALQVAQNARTISLLEKVAAQRAK